MIRVDQFERRRLDEWGWAIKRYITEKIFKDAKLPLHNLYSKAEVSLCPSVSIGLVPNVVRALQLHLVITTPNFLDINCGEEALRL